MKRKLTIKLSSFQIITLGFIGIILLGAILLMFPISSKSGVWTPFINALFTSTSAVCVTGLVVYDTALYWSVFGQVVILLLIQIGGMGVVTMVAAFVMISGKKLGLLARGTIRDAVASHSIGGIIRYIGFILKAIFLIELIGALIMLPVFVIDYGAEGIWMAIFHSVSAFCNAGIDILGSGSLTKYVSNPLINLTTMLLIILGGLGFTVWFDVIGNGRKIWKHEVPRKWWFTRLTLQSKLVLVTTASLILLGAALVLILEFHNPDTIGGMSLGDKVMASFFQSVTNRTAGYATISQSGLHSETKLVNSILMVIGGSPGGTAGGIKTTTFVMLFLACMTFVKGGNDIECMGRKITTENFRSGFAVMLLAFTAYIAGILLILIFEPDQVLTIDVIYEASSAIGTVGLSADLTPNLTRASQIVLMIMMYIGRLGPMTLVLVFAGKANPRDKIRELPHERIMVG